jgi:hypothetical protein
VKVVVSAILERYGLFYVQRRTPENSFPGTGSSVKFKTLRQARTYKERVEAAVRSLWSRGLYPSPTAVNRAIGRTPSSNLGGQGPKFRRDEMCRIGIPFQRKNTLLAWLRLGVVS